MNAYSSYTIQFNGKQADIAKATEVLAETLNEPSLKAPCQEVLIEETRVCWWIADIEELAAKMALEAPGLQFTVSGVVDSAGECMDFLITCDGEKVLSQTSGWYIMVEVDDFVSYDDFATQLCNKNGEPLYSEAEYEEFRANKVILYIMDSGHGNIVTAVSLGEAKDISRKRGYKKCAFCGIQGPVNKMLEGPGGYFCEKCYTEAEARAKELWERCFQ